MNQETGEVRQLSTEEVAKLNGSAGRELWKPYDDTCPSNRKERRALERKQAKLARKSR
jgi:hypothetical protein